jgi:hypothetical protein
VAETRVTLNAGGLLLMAQKAYLEIERARAGSPC